MNTEKNLYESIIILVIIFLGKERLSIWERKSDTKTEIGLFNSG